MTEQIPLLIVLGGLPGTGKTTIARQVADQLGATYLRIDTIEQALRSALGLKDDVGPAGYVVAYAISETNLASGRTVVADCVNPVAATREAWRLVAANGHSPIVEVELFCSDAVEHRRRVETRTIDIAGLLPPSWAQVVARDYEDWPAPTLRIDTALVDPATSARLIIEQATRIRATAKESTSD